ncbi:MAG: HPr family phosphocarrier protein [Lachnospiraceae bacterium]|nr:HPr family phosphocarrier protein [Lachnospiraceae bacterium]
MVTKTIKLGNPAGLDARPVALFVQIASQFESSIYVGTGSKKVNAKSIMGMMTLDLGPGAQVQVSIDGDDESAAIEKIEAYLSAD